MIRTSGKVRTFFLISHKKGDLKWTAIMHLRLILVLKITVLFVGVNHVQKPHGYCVASACLLLVCHYSLSPFLLIDDENDRDYIDELACVKCSMK